MWYLVNGLMIKPKMIKKIKQGKSSIKILFPIVLTYGANPIIIPSWFLTVLSITAFYRGGSNLWVCAGNGGRN